jgi:hypothetical protein
MGTLREELQEVMRYHASQSKAMRDALLDALDGGSVRLGDTDQTLEMLFASNTANREAIFRLAEHVERIEMRLGPEDDD